MTFTAKKTFALIAIVLICRLVASCFLPVFDPSEARYASICANMAASGNFLEPQFVNNGVLSTFEGKPPLYFQMGAICCKIFGTCEFSTRLPAMVSAIGILLLIYFAVRKLRDEQTASLATLLGALSPVFLGFSGFCMTDLLLAFAIGGAVCCYTLFLAEPEKRRKKLYSLGFFAALGVGMIVKGPVALVMAGLPILLFTVFNRRWRDLKDHAWLGGILLFLLIAAPWYWMMQAKNPDFLEYFFVNENFKRFLFKEYGDRYGAGRESFRGMAFVFMLACNLPALIGALLLLKHRSKSFFKCFRDPLVGMALIWLISNTLFWCLTSRVLITYLLPTIPAAAIAVADGLMRNGFGTSRKSGTTFLVFGGLCAVLCLAAPWSLPTMRDNGGHFFARLTKQPEFSGMPLYFMRKTPHSAEFYAAKRVRNHPDESWLQSMQKSADCLLLVTERELKKYGMPKNYRIVAKEGVWQALSPLKCPAHP